MGPLQIKMTLSNLIGDQLENSGWVEILVKANIGTSGIAKSFLKSSQPKCLRYAYQVTCAELSMLMNEAYQKTNQNGDLNSWITTSKGKSVQFLYWCTVFELEMMLLAFVKSLRISNYKMFLSCLDYFSNLDLNSLNDSKKFWKNIKPLFSDKGSTNDKIMICEKEEIVSNEKEVADLMNNHFVNVTKELNLKQDIEEERSIRLDDIIDKYKQHESIKVIKSDQTESNTFSFKQISTSELESVINDLKINKGSLSNSIPAKILKENSNAHILNLKNVINKSIASCTFPNKLKLAEVIPVYKKSDSLNRENYRPISLLSNDSKIFERILFNQISEFIEPYLSKLLTGFCKNHSK